MVWLPRWGCDGMIFGSNQKLLMAQAQVLLWSDLAYVGSQSLTWNSIPAGTRSYSISESVSASNTYIILTANSSSTSDYNSITGCSVNGTTASPSLIYGTASSYSSFEDRSSVAIFTVSGISGSSLEIDISASGSDTYRSVAAVYKVVGPITVRSTQTDVATPGDATVSASISIPSDGFCIAALVAVQNGTTVSFDTGVSSETAVTAGGYLALLPASTENTGSSYVISGDWLDNDANGSARLLLAAFN